MRNVVLSLLGTTLDRAPDGVRWERWRPTVSLFQHEDFLIDRLELIVNGPHRELADQVASDIRMVSPESEVRIHSMPWQDAWDFEEVYGSLMDFCQSYPFNRDEEQYLAHLTTGTHVAQICLFLLTESRHFPGRLIQSSPPQRHQSIAGRYSIIDLDLSRYDSIAARFHKQSMDGLAFLKNGIATRNKEFNHLVEEIEKVAIHSHAPILILGPTGSGKTQLAKRIYALKRSRNQISGEFIAINCATLRGDTAMATLFGHTKNAFTGAASKRDGLLISANGGMVFLDEIGELGLDEQATLLQAVEEKRFRPLGSDMEVTSDFQVIAGTNRDLQHCVRAGTFRADLLARINLWTYRLPGLRERPEDIEPNILFECQRFEESHGRKIQFSQEAHKAYLKFATSPGASWDGNFRDLTASITRMATLAGPHRISPEIVQNEISRLRKSWLPTSHDHDHDPLVGLISGADLAQFDLFDQMQLRETVRVCQSCESISDAGRQLFQVSRLQKSSPNDANRLSKFLKRFNLDWKSIQPAPMGKSRG